MYQFVATQVSRWSRVRWLGGLQSTRSCHPAKSKSQRRPADESVCKPDSVPVARGRPSICDCRCRQPDAAHPRTRAGSPQSFAQPTPGADLLALLQVGFTKPPGSPRPLVVSYTTVSPLPPEGGGLFSVALSRGSLRMGVSHHPALGSPDFPRYFR